VEKEHFKKLIEVLNPSFKPPTRQALAEKDLDAFYDDTVAETIKLLKNEKEVVLIPDGSSDNCGDPIINVMVIPIGCQKPLLYKSINCSTERLTAKDLFEKITIIVEELKVLISR